MLQTEKQRLKKNKLIRSRQNRKWQSQDAARFIWSESSCFFPKVEKLNCGWGGSGRSRGMGTDSPCRKLPTLVHTLQACWSQGVTLSWASEKRDPTTCVTSRRVFISRIFLLNGRERKIFLKWVKGDKFAGILNTWIWKMWPTHFYPYPQRTSSLNYSFIPGAAWVAAFFFPSDYDLRGWHEPMIKNTSLLLNNQRVCTRWC